MKNIYLILIICVWATISGTGQTLTGKIFEIGGEKENCRISGACDCCTSEIYFINDKQFALFDYCLFEYFLSTGTYKIVSNNLVLSFKQVSVESGTDEEKRNEYLRRKVAEIKPMTFQIGKCDDGEAMLENKEFKEYKFGFRKSTTGESKRIADLLKTPEWKLILE